MNVNENGLKNKTIYKMKLAFIFRQKQKFSIVFASTTNETNRKKPFVFAFPFFLVSNSSEQSKIIQCNGILRLTLLESAIGFN